MGAPLVVTAAAAAVASSAPVLWWAVLGARPSSVERNLRAGLPQAADLRQIMLSRSAGERAVRPTLASLAGRVRSMTPVGYVERLERNLVLAGRARSWPVERVLVAKVVLTAVAAVVGFGLAARGGPWTLIGAFAAVLAFVTPDVLVRGRAAERQKQIRRDMPDTIDQITITVEAGLGLESAMARVARAGTSPLSAELIRVLQDVQVGVPRVQALRRLLDRTDVPELRQFVNAVIQAESYGVPVARVLRVQSGELREKRKQWAEERAMKLPVKVLFPLITCILPTLFIVMMGPAVLDIADLMGDLRR